MSAGWWVPWVYFLYWSCGKWALDGEYCGFEPQLHLQIPRRQLRLKTACLFRKEVVATGYYPTNAPRGFHVETTWKGSFPRRFNVESTWCVCRVHKGKKSKQLAVVLSGCKSNEELLWISHVKLINHCIGCKNTDKKENNTYFMTLLFIYNS